MLKLELESVEYFDSVKMEFVKKPPKTIYLEHSLKSVSEWESEYMKPFFGKEPKTDEELFYYIKCMSDNMTDEDLNCLTQKNLDDIEKYISSSRTATRINKNQNEPPSREIITTELMYYWMVANNIPFECENWNINRLWTLINICNIKNAPPKKMSKKSLLSRNASLNAARKKSMNTRG